jgi:hypothetical protein
MAGVMPATYQEAMMKLLQQIAVAKAAPDANLDELSKIEEQTIASIRKPYDTQSPGSPVGASMDMSAGAGAPAGASAPGELSPMLAALMGGGGGGSPAPALPPAGSFPMGGGVMAGPQAPPMDEVRRMLNPG